MRYHAFFAVVLMLLATTWAAGCGGEPTVVAPQEELVASQDQRAKPPCNPQEDRGPEGGAGPPHI